MGFDGVALEKLFSVETGVFSIAALVFVFIVRAWNSVPEIMGKWVEYRHQRATEAIARDKALADAKDSDWRRLREEIERLDERCIRLEAAEERCREELASVREALNAERGERVRFERLLLGEGEVRQAAAHAAAEIRLDDADKKKREKDKGAGI